MERMKKVFQRVGNYSRLKPNTVVPSVVCLIPASSGSQKMPKKNLRLLNGMPLVAWAVIQAKRSTTIDEVYVFTDDYEIASVAREYGAQVPFVQPKDDATDEAANLDAFRNFISWFKKNWGTLPELIVQVRPSCPLRSPSEIDRAVTLMIENPSADSLITVKKTQESHYKMWTKKDDLFLNPPPSDNGPKDPCDSPIQALSETLVQDGVVGVVRPTTIIDLQSISGNSILYLETLHEIIDVDVQDDLDRAEMLVGSGRLPKDVCPSQPFVSRLGIVLGRLSYSEGGQLQYFPSRSWQDEFSYAKELRLSHIEWFIPRSTPNTNPLFTVKGRNEMLRVSKSNGVAINAVCLDPLLDISLKSKKDEGAIQYVERTMASAAEIGIHSVVLPLMEKSLPDIESSETRELLSYLGEVAKSIGTKLHLEVTLPADQMKKLIDGLSTKQVGYCLDTGNVTAKGYKTSQYIETLGLSISHVHLKKVNHFGKSIPFKRGMPNLTNIVKALERLGYRGSYTMESARGRNPIQTAKLNREMLIETALEDETRRRDL